MSHLVGNSEDRFTCVAAQSTRDIVIRLTIKMKRAPQQNNMAETTNEAVRAFAREKQQFGFPTRSDTNWHVQSQKQARSLKFRILGEEGLYYPCSENKDADQLCSYSTADLRLCFCTCRLLVLWCGGSDIICIEIRVFFLIRGCLIIF